MASGNWRSGKGHGPAEVGSRQHIFDGYAMRTSGTFDYESDAKCAASGLESEGYHTAITKGRKKWTVWRTYHRNQSRINLPDDALFDGRTGLRIR